MNEFYKIVVVIIAGVLLSLFLKQSRPDFAMLISIVVGIMVLVFVLSQVQTIFSFLNKILSVGGIDNNLFLILIKVVVIGYLTDFTSTIAIDSGNSMLSDKVLIAGRVMMFVVSIPIFSSLFSVILELIT